MTTRWKQKASSLLAITSVIVLLLLIIFLWEAVKNGVFSPTSTNVYNKVNYSENSDKNHFRIDSLASNSSTIKDDVNQSSSSSSKYPPTPPIQLPTTNNKDDIVMNEFVKPSKIHIQSLHRDDLLYESQKINPGEAQFSTSILCPVV
ncbi:hypothetical protein Bhyg_15211, partial [Pseudolycoriella hygida]